MVLDKERRAVKILSHAQSIVQTEFLGCAPPEGGFDALISVARPLPSFFPGHEYTVKNQDEGARSTRVGANATAAPRL
jgi:hypothetical protein